MHKSHRSSRNAIEHADIWRPDDLVEMDAVVSACALVAQADGWVTPEERKRTIERMTRSAAIAQFGAHEVVAAFEALVTQFECSPDQSRSDAESAVRRVRSDPRSARWLVETACAVAEADGGLDWEERVALLRLCNILDLDPRDFALVASQEEDQ